MDARRPVRHLVVDDCVRLDFNQHFRINKSRDFDHGCRRRDLGKRFLMSASNLRPEFYISDKYPRSYHVFEPTTSLFQGGTNHVDATLRLHIGIADTDHLSVITDRRSPGYRDEITDAHGP